MTIITDTFNRANETPLAGNWTLITGHNPFNLTTNQIVPSNLAALDLGDRYSGATFGNDQSSKARLFSTGTTAGTGPGLCVRCASAANTYYRVVLNHAATNNVVLSRAVAGVVTGLSTSTRAWTEGDGFELRVTGPAAAAALTVYHNGVSIVTTTDNSSLASGSPGVVTSTAVSAGTALDDWAGADVFLPDLTMAPLTH